jgi:hypothetical protein
MKVRFRWVLALATLVLAVAQIRPGFQAWVADPHRRVYFGSFGRDSEPRRIQLEAARNETAIFQLAARSSENVAGLSARVSDLRGPAGAIPNSAARVRYPGFLPVDENGQYTPDPLYVREIFDLKANETQPVWIDVTVPENSEPGAYAGKVEIKRGGANEAAFDISLQVLDFTLPPVNRDHFYSNIFLDPGSVARLHKVARWSDEHWRLLERYVRNWADHSQDAIVVFFIEDPWDMDTGFPVASVVDWKLGGEWEKTPGARFDFDNSHFDRFVQMCLDPGIRQNLQAWSPVNQPHKDYAIIHYRDTSANQDRKLKVTAGTPEYERVWGQFAASFDSHLREKRWLDMTTVGLDEISTEALDKIVPVFRKVAPNLKLMVSGGDEKGKYSDFSPEMAFHYGYIQSEVPLPDRAARRRQGKRTLVYTAESPLYPNTFLFSQPLESRMIPWLVWKYDFDGYIRWAWNFWVDGFMEQPHYKWHSGDMFFVYPGPDGPLDSIRSEMLRKGAQDYEVLWMIRQTLDALRSRGAADKVKAAEEQIRQAMELATQEADPVRPYRPLTSDFPKARGMLNRVLLDLKKKG